MRRIVHVFLLLSLVCSALAPGQGKGKGKGKKQGEAALEPSQGAGRRFLPQETQIITGYYGSDSGNLPPGLAKRGGNLPPGLQKQLQRNGQLPPGLQKRLEPFPVVLERRLPPLPQGCRRVVVGSSALLIDDTTNVVLDVLDLTRRR
jgi:hypothetical protein